MKRFMGLLIAGALVATACGGAGSESSTPVTDQTSTTEDVIDSEPPEETTTTVNDSAPLPDPCSYVEDAQMSQILGIEVSGDNLGSPDICSYDPISSEESGGVSLDFPDLFGTGCDNQFTLYNFDDANPSEPVEGVGTYARYREGPFGGVLAVCFNDTATLIASLQGASDDPTATLVEVAKAVEPNLP